MKAPPSEKPPPVPPPIDSSSSNIDEEIDKEEWGPRIELYISLWKDKFIDNNKE